MSEARIILGKVECTSIRQRIAEKLRDSILNGSIRPGQRLVERNIANECQTSVTGVREALIELEGEGFVTKKANSGTRVIELSLHDIEKSFAVRSVLETFAVEEAARTATHEDLDVLDKCYLAMLDAARLGDGQLMIIKDIALHVAIWQIPGNEFLYAALRRAVLPIFAYTAIRASQQNPIGLAQAAASHLPLLRAIKAKDPETARDAFLAALNTWGPETRLLISKSEYQDREQAG